MQVVLRENNTAVLVTLIIILKITYLLSISKSEANPVEVYSIWPRVPELLH